jgi:hypothetical protein
MANAAKLIADPKTRAARAQEKVRLVLRFLRDECWTTAEIAAQVLGVQYPAAHRTLHQMQRDHYLKSEELVLYSRDWKPSPEHAPAQATTEGAAVKRLTGRKVVIWGITAHGLAYAWDLAEDVVERPAFEVGRTSPTYIAHYVGIQRLRVVAERAGWQSWCVGKFLMNTGLDKVPDGEAIDPTGARVAVEFEREIKTAKRYQAIVGAYLVALRAGRWNRVDYVCPTADMAARLQRVIYGLHDITHKGQRTAINRERHLDNRITFTGVEDWPRVRAESS